MNGRNYYSFVKGDGLIEFFALNSTVLDNEIDSLEQAEIHRLKKNQKKLHKLRAQKKLSDKQTADLQAIENEIEESEAFLARRKAIAAAQLPWLKEELADSRARWKVVFMHHSIYSSAYRKGGHGKSPRVLRIRAMLEPILLENKVDVVFGGHDHVYERTKPQPPDSATGHRVQYFTQGAASKLRPHDLDRASPYFAAGEDSRHSFLIVQTKNSSMQVQALDADGRIIDRHEIQK